MNIRLVSSGSLKFRLWGFEQQVPWLTTATYREFLHKSIDGHSLLIGRKTFELLSSLDALPNDFTAIVLSSRLIESKNVITCPSLQCGLEKAHELKNDLVVLGGLKIFEELIDSANEIFFMRFSEPLRDGECFPEFSKDVFRRVSIEPGRIESDQSTSEFGHQEIVNKIWSYDIQKFFRRSVPVIAKGAQ